MSHAIRKQSLFANRGVPFANWEAKCTICKRVLLFVDCTLFFADGTFFRVWGLPYTKITPLSCSLTAHT